MSISLDKVWETANVPAFNRPIRIHCKTGSLSAKLVFETRAKCQHFAARYKDDGIPYAVESPFCKFQYQYHGPPVQEKLEDDLCLFGKIWPHGYKSSFQNLMLKIPSLSPHLTTGHINILDRRNGVGKPIFKLAPPRHEQLFDLAARGLCEPSIPDDVQRQVICQANLLAQDRAATV